MEVDITISVARASGCGTATARGRPRREVKREASGAQRSVPSQISDISDAPCLALSFRRPGVRHWCSRCSDPSIDIEPLDAWTPTTVDRVASSLDHRGPIISAKRTSRGDRNRLKRKPTPHFHLKTSRGSGSERHAVLATVWKLESKS